MITTQVSYEQTVKESGHIEVLQITKYYEDGKYLTRKFHRHVVSPTDDITNEDERTKNIAAAMNTPAVISDYIKRQINSGLCQSPEVKAAYEAAMADGVITEEEEKNIWQKFKAWAFS